MTRLLLRALNAPGLIFIVILGIALQTSLFTAWPLSYVQPDVILIVVIWCALKRGFAEGGLITLILGNIGELHSAASQGLMLISYMAVYLMVRGMARVVVMRGHSSAVTITLISSVAWKVTGLAVLYSLGASANQWRHTLVFLVPGALIEAALGHFAYRWLESYDRMTYKNARADASLEGELQLEGEGI